MRGGHVNELILLPVDPSGQPFCPAAARGEQLVGKVVLRLESNEWQLCLSYAPQLLCHVPAASLGCVECMFSSLVSTMLLRRS